MADSADGFITLEEARGLFAGNPPRARVTSWARAGLDRGRIKLRTKRAGQPMMTKPEWCAEFQAAMDAYFAAGRKSQNGKAPETPSQAKKRRQARGKRLDKAGVK